MNEDFENCIVDTRDNLSFLWKCLEIAVNAFCISIPISTKTYMVCIIVVLIGTKLEINKVNYQECP